MDNRPVTELNEIAPRKRHVAATLSAPGYQRAAQPVAPITLDEILGENGLNEVDLLLSALRQLSHDGNTIARPLGLVLTKWDTQGPITAAAPDGEEQRAHAWLSERPEFRQLLHALQHAGHPDRVKVFPVSAFGENVGLFLPQSTLAT